MGPAKGISFSFAAKSSTTPSTSGKVGGGRAVARSTATGIIGFTVLPQPPQQQTQQQQQQQQQQPSSIAAPALSFAVGLRRDASEQSLGSNSSSSSSSSSIVSSTTDGRGGGRPRRVVVGKTVFEATPPIQQAAIDVPALGDLDWAEETHHGFGCSGGDRQQQWQEELAPAPTPSPHCASSLGASTDSSGFTSSSSSSGFGSSSSSGFGSSSEQCMSFFRNDEGRLAGGLPEAFGLDEDTELMAFLENSNLAPDDLTLLPLDSPPHEEDGATRSSTSGSSTSESVLGLVADRASSLPLPSPKKLPGKRGEGTKGAAAAAAKGASSAKTKKKAAGAGTGAGSRGAAATKLATSITSASAAAAAAALPPLSTRSFVASPFQVVKQPAPGGSPSSPSSSAAATGGTSASCFSFRDLNAGICSPSISASLAARPVFRRSTSASSMASSASSSSSSSSSSSNRTIKTILVGGPVGQQQQQLLDDKGAWPLRQPLPQPQQQPQPHQPQPHQPQPQQQHTAACLPTAAQQQIPQPPQPAPGDATGPATGGEVSLLLLEGKPFQFDVGGDEMDDDEEEFGGEEGLSTSTLEILIEHFSCDGFGDEQAAAAAAATAAAAAPLLPLDVEEHARGAF